MHYPLSLALSIFLPQIPGKQSSRPKESKSAKSLNGEALKPTTANGRASKVANVRLSKTAAVATATKPVRRSTRASTAAAVPMIEMGTESVETKEDSGPDSTPFCRMPSPAAQQVQKESVEPTVAAAHATTPHKTPPQQQQQQPTSEDDATPTAAAAPPLFPAETPGTAVKQRMRALEDKILTEKSNSCTKTPKPVLLPGQHRNVRGGVSSVVQRFEMLSPSSASPQHAGGSGSSGVDDNGGSIRGEESNLGLGSQSKDAAQQLAAPSKDSSKASAGGKRRSEGEGGTQLRDCKRRNLAPKENSSCTASKAPPAGIVASTESRAKRAIAGGIEGVNDSIAGPNVIDNGEINVDSDACADDADDEIAPTPGKRSDQYVSRKKDVLGVTRQLNRRLPSRKGTYNMGSTATAGATSQVGRAAATKRTAYTPKGNSLSWLKASSGANAGKAGSAKPQRTSPRFVRMEQSSRVSTAVASIETTKPTGSGAAATNTKLVSSKQSSLTTTGAAPKSKIALGVKTLVPARKPAERKRTAVVVPALEKARLQRAAQSEKDAQKAAEVAERKRNASEMQRRREMRVKERVAQEEALRQKREEEDKRRAQRIKDDKIRREKEALDSKQRNIARAVEHERKRKEREAQEKRNRAVKREAELERKRAEKEAFERNRKQQIQAELRQKRDDLRAKQSRQEQMKREREKKEFRRKQLEAQIEQARKQKEADKAAAAANAARRKAPPPPTEHLNYDISDLQSDCSTDEEDDPRQRVPTWAQGKELKMALYNQHILRPRDGSDIFDDVPAPDLDEIFPMQPGKARKIRARTSSALWSPSPTSGLHQKM